MRRRRRLHNAQRHPRRVGADKIAAGAHECLGGADGRSVEGLPLSDGARGAAARASAMKRLAQLLSGKVNALAQSDIGIGVLRWRGGDLVDHPLADAPELKRIVAGFAAGEPWQTVQEAGQWLTSLNETPAFSVERRYQLIDTLDGASRASQARLAERYFKLGAADFVEEKRLWNTLTAFWSALGNAYWLCARQCAGGKTVLPQGQRQRIAARGLRALRQQVKWTLLRYGALDPDVWRACGELTALAEAAGEAAQPVKLYADSIGSISPYDAFTRLVMLWTAAPGSLSPTDQDIAERLVLYLSAKFRLLPRQEKRCDYFFGSSGTRVGDFGAFQSAG
ncbi:MAG: hypothetical protein FJY56_22185, partial [Betaproteobacteria bacterium]|nr:hypothetical protein [Betaproteobacteria bacterium]